MDFGDLLELLLKKQDRKLHRWLGAVLIGLPLVFLLAGGLEQEVDGNGQMFASGWFREVFVVTLSLFVLLGLMILIVGWSRRKGNEDDEQQTYAARAEARGSRRIDRQESRSHKLETRSAGRCLALRIWYTRRTLR